MSSTDERDTLRERIAREVFCYSEDAEPEWWDRALAGEFGDEFHSRATVAHCRAAAYRILALLDSPVGEPEPDALREAEAVMRSACILLTDDLQRGDGVLTMEKVREAYTLLFDFLHTDIDRRSKLPGAVISDEGETLELARQDGFAFWAARYVDERDMKPTGAEIIHEAQAHSRMRMKQPGGPFAGLRRRLEAGEIGPGQNVRRLDERVLAEIATEGGLDATTVGSVEIDEPLCERCGQRQPLVSMHFCGGKSAALFRVEFTADTLSDGTPCVVARDHDQPEYYGFGADDEEAFQRLLRLRRARIEAYREAAGIAAKAIPGHYASGVCAGAISRRADQLEAGQ